MSRRPGGGMRDEKFEWDDEKARANIKRHDVSFEDARGVFDDPSFLDEPDESMDYGEERFLAIGMVNTSLIAVVYTPRVARIRIISARKATSKEHHDYARQNPHG